MTSKRRAALAYETQSRGIDYGQTIARLAIEQFLDGFDDEAGEGMQKIVKTAVTSALDKLAAGGVRKSLREAHEGGFYAGARYLYRLCRRLPCSCRAECGSRLKRLFEDLHPASNSPEPDAQGSGTYDNRTHSSSFRQTKKKAVQFKCGRPLANKRHGGSEPIRRRRKVPE